MAGAKTTRALKTGRKNTVKRKRTAHEDDWSPDISELIEFSQPPPRKAIKCDYTDTIKVIVGDEKESIVHTAVAEGRSEYFKAACSKRWPEGREKVVGLQEEEAEIFAVVVGWMHTEKLEMTESLMNMAKVWALGNYLGCEQLRHQVIDLMRHHLSDEDREIPVDTLCFIWHNTPDGSTIRRLLRDASIGREVSKDEVFRFPQELTLEVVWRAFNGMPLPKVGARCEYHEHQKDGSCTVPVHGIGFLGMTVTDEW